MCRASIRRRRGRSGSGLGYTTFTREQLTADATVGAGAEFRASVLVRNSGSRAGTDVVQLYAHDEVASVARPVAQLIGFQRVSLEAGAEQRVEFTVPTGRLAFTGVDGIRGWNRGGSGCGSGGACDDEETSTAIEIVG